MEELNWVTSSFFVEADFAFAVFIPKFNLLLLGKDPYGKRSLLIHTSRNSSELLVSSNYFGSDTNEMDVFEMPPNGTLVLSLSQKW